MVRRLELDWNWQWQKLVSLHGYHLIGSPDSSRKREARLKHTLPCGTDTLGRHSMLLLGSFNFSGLIIPALKGL